MSCTITRRRAIFVDTISYARLRYCALCGVPAQSYNGLRSTGLGQFGLGICTVCDVRRGAEADALAEWICDLRFR